MRDKRGAAQSRLEDDEASDVDGANYQLEMMRCLREVNVDNNTVGWCAAPLGVRPLPLCLLVLLSCTQNRVPAFRPVAKASFDGSV